MAPSTTPNFSRPLRSPLSTAGLDTPVRGTRGRRAVEDLPPAEALSNTDMPGRALTRELSPTKLFDMAGSRPVLDKPAENDEGKHASKTGSPRRRHLRKLSKIGLKTTSETPPTTQTSVDLGGLEKPIVSFRPQLWRHLERDRDVLNLDLFWPIKIKAKDKDGEEDETDDSGDDSKEEFPFKELKPLQTFHNLHYLRLAGMMQSYQPIIWATCWVNKNLTKVHLEMALEPEINEDVAHNYRKIDGTWYYNPKADPPAQCEYLGSGGDGILHEEFGYGEYLDQQAMKAGQMEVVKSLPLENMRYLPITELTLMNFVVDSGPFFRWFDPKKLKSITLLETCVDGGFYLPEEMRSSVKVNSPNPKPPMIARRIRPGELKLIELKGGKVVSSKPVEPAAVAGLKSKFSQIMPKWGSKGKGKEELHCHCCDKEVKDFKDSKEKGKGKDAHHCGDKEVKDSKDKDKGKGKDAHHAGDKDVKDSKDKAKGKEPGQGQDTAQLERNLANMGL